MEPSTCHNSVSIISAVFYVIYLRCGRFESCWWNQALCAAADLHADRESAGRMKFSDQELTNHLQRSMQELITEEEVAHMSRRHVQVDP